jgi:hypothetical protein
MSFGEHSHFLTLPTWKGSDTKTAVCRVKKIFPRYFNIYLIIQLKADDDNLRKPLINIAGCYSQQYARLHVFSSKSLGFVSWSFFSLIIV